MNRHSTSMSIRVLGLLLALCASATGAAERESMRVYAELWPAEELAERSVAVEPVVYNRYSTSATLSSYADRPHLGTALDYAGSGPQMAISAVRVFLHSRSAQVHERIRIELKFWGAHNPSAQAVFSNAPHAAVLGIELVGPYILQADTAYGTIVELPEPVLVDARASTGIGMRVLAGNIGDENLMEYADLVPAFDTATVGQVGSVLETYAEIGGTRDDFNFAPVDILRDVNDPQKKLPLAITLYGKGQRMVQCGNWESYENAWVEEFDNPDSFYQRWLLSPNGSDATFRMDGSYMLRNMGTNGSFAYLRANGTPIPQSGEFSVRWRARYLTLAPNGTGTLVLSKGTLANGASEQLGPRAVWAWQDTAEGFVVHVKTQAGTERPYTVAQPVDGTMHDIEYCWLANTVELWVDGTRVLQQARNANLQRPDSMWFGNHVITGDPNGQWNHMQLYRVHVRTPPDLDRIFRHGFEAP